MVLREYMHELKKRRTVATGFTLIELIVAIVIVGILAGVGIPMYMTYQEWARESTTKQNLQLLKSQLGIYNMQHGKYPQKLIDLAEKPKTEVKGWKQLLEKIPQDGWGNDFYYRPTPGGKHPYELYSYGGSGGPEEPAERRISVWDL